MSDVIPYNEYILIEPDGRCRGFTDYEGAKAYVNIYYERFVDKKIDESDYNDLTDIGGENSREAICAKAGAEIGLCQVYKIEDFINQVNKELVFEDEKEEVISKVIDKNIDLNIKDYNLDLVLAELESVDLMEPYVQIKW